jgi:mannose-6-phosphate isomerase-like protein (cupin superfamily)
MLKRRAGLAGRMARAAATKGTVTPRHARVVNLDEKFAKFTDLWSPKAIARVDEYEVKLVKVNGEFPEHTHEAEDELFLVFEGELRIRLPDGEARVGPGEMIVVPRGTKHRPSAVVETKLLLLERVGVVNTGEKRTAQTRKVAPI